MRRTGSSGPPPAKRVKRDESTADDDFDAVDVDLALSEGDEQVAEHGHEATALSKAPPATKIIFCSRTHSQLKQFLHELRDSPYGDSVRAITLGSRQNLCVNSKVASLGSTARINEACLDLQKKPLHADPATTAPSKCAFLDQRLLKQFAASALVHKPLDIEDLADAGKSRCCPYYASRMAIADAEVE